MNDNLKLLIETVTLFPEDAFYNNSYSQFDVKLQGKYSSLTVIKANELGFINSVNMGNGYVYMVKDGITLILTD